MLRMLLRPRGRGPSPSWVLHAPSPDFRSVALYFAFPPRSMCYQGKGLSSPSDWAPCFRVCDSRVFCCVVRGGRDEGPSACWCSVCSRLPSAWGAPCLSHFLLLKRPLSPLRGLPWLRLHETIGHWAEMEVFRSPFSPPCPPWFHSAKAPGVTTSLPGHAMGPV